MWLTMSSSENLLPSSSSVWHNTVSRSVPSLPRRSLTRSREVVLQQFARLEAPPPGERRHAGADDRVAGAGGGGERLVHLGDQLVVGARLMSHEHHRGDVEGQLLHRRIKQEARVVGHPVVGDHLRYHLVHLLDVADQPGPDERLLHDPPVEHVLFEVEQHQPAVKERPDHRDPALLRVVLVAVGVDDLRGVGAQRRDRRQDRRVPEHDRAPWSGRGTSDSPVRRATSRSCAR